MCSSDNESLNQVENEDQEQTFKTPISTLQEYCQKLGKTPQYDLTALEGRAHQPQFVYRCIVGEIVSTGQGGSKKQAKHAAAEAALKALTTGLLPEGCKPLAQNGLVAEESVPEPSEEPIDDNPVGSLQELVVARGWRLPEYSLAHETGPAHKKEFIICCTVETFKEYGSGSAKKHAKRLSASKMYHKIVGLPPETKDSVTTQSRESKNKISLDEICNSVGEKVTDLKITNDNALMNHCELLDEVAKNNNFEAIYKDLCTNTSFGSVQCILELTTQPISIFHGTGESKLMAYNKAAHDALEYINLFCKNSEIDN